MVTRDIPVSLDRRLFHPGPVPKLSRFAGLQYALDFIDAFKNAQGKPRLYPSVRAIGRQQLPTFALTAESCSDRRFGRGVVGIEFVWFATWRRQLHLLNPPGVWGDRFRTADPAAIKTARQKGNDGQ